MEDNLILGDGVNDGEGEEVFVDDTPLVEIITACVNAISVAETYDAIFKEDKARKKRILRKSFRLIDYGIAELYAQVFGDEDEEQD